MDTYLPQTTPRNKEDQNPGSGGKCVLAESQFAQIANIRKINSDEIKDSVDGFISGHA